MRRLFWILLILVVILAGGWTGGWFALASWIEARIPQAFAEIADRGVQLECERQEVVGFPFALHVDCGRAQVAEQSTGSAAEIGGVSGGWSVLEPLTAAVALESPAHVESALLPGGAEVQWGRASLGFGLGMNGPQTASFEAVDLAGQVGGANVAAERATGTVSPAEDGGTSAQASFAGLVLSDGTTTLPPLDGDVSGWISVPPRALAAGRAGLQAPISARLTDSAIVIGDSRVELEGDVTVDAEGILDGVVTVRIVGTEGLQALILALPPERQELGNKAIGGLLLFGAPVTVDGAAASELTVNIVRGVVKVGPVEETLPRIPL